MIHEVPKKNDIFYNKIELKIFVLYNFKINHFDKNPLKENELNNQVSIQSSQSNQYTINELI